MADALAYKKTFTQASGLSQSTVYDIEQDLNGYIWLATQSGIDRFDGYSFVTFGQSTPTQNGLSSLRILDLELDHTTGDLWVGTAAGLDKLNAQTGLFEPVDVVSALGNKHKRFGAVHFDTKGNLWIDADGKLFVKRLQSEIFEEVPIPTNDPQFSIFEIESDKNGILYLASNAGVFRLHTNSNEWLNTLLDQHIIYSVFVDGNKALWVGSNGNGLYRFEFDDQYNVLAQNTITLEQGLSNNIVNDIAQSANGAIWAATNSGLTIFPDHQSLTPASTSKLDSDKTSIVYSIFINDVDEIIYGTLINGFSIVSPNSLLFNTVNIPDNRVAYSTAIDSEETLWVATPEGLWAISKDLQKQSLLKYEAGDINYGAENTFMSVHYSKVDNTVWVSTRIGLARVNSSKDGITSVAFPGIPIYSLDSDEQGNLFLGTITEGFYHYNTKTNEVLSHFNLGRVLNIHVSSATEVWVATLEGLVKINPIEQTQIVYTHNPNNPDSIVSNQVAWVSSMSENQYFVGMQGNGLQLMSIDKLTSEVSFKALFPDTELKNVSIGAVAQDQFSDFWVTTIKGVAKIDADLSSITFYDKADGTNPGGYFIGANSKNSEGRIFFAGSHGVNHFHPSEINRPSTMPPLHITSIEILNENLGRRTIDAKTNALLPIKQKSLDLDHRDIVITFEIAAIELVSPDKIQYAYRLRGFNERWQALDSDKRSITYTSLDAGDYTLEIKATNRYSEWNSEQIEMDIQVAPPWYFSTVAIVCWIILAILAIYSYARWRSRTHYKRSQELAKEVAKKTKDLEIVAEQLRLLSNLDPLTKIYNRRGFTYTINSQLKLSDGTDKHFSVVLFDIDLFKQINDKYGHDVGDEILIAVTKIIQQSLDIDDILGRWGGEEFIVFLPDHNIDSAFAVAETLRKTFEQTSLDALGDKINVTLSGGIAVMQASDNIDNCIKQADVLLYQAKQNGRNQICYKLI